MAGFEHFIFRIRNFVQGLDDAEGYLDELKELFGCFLLPCTSTRQTSSKYNSTEPGKKPKAMKRKEKQETRKAVDENLNKIRSNVSALRSMVLEMDTETDGKFRSKLELDLQQILEQNEMLERINRKAKENERRVQATTDNAKKILESEKLCRLM